MRKVQVYIDTSQLNDVRAGSTVIGKHYSHYLVIQDKRIADVSYPATGEPQFVVNPPHIVNVHDGEDLLIGIFFHAPWIENDKEIPLFGWKLPYGTIPVSPGTRNTLSTPQFDFVHYSGKYAGIYGGASVNYVSLAIP